MHRHYLTNYPQRLLETFEDMLFIDCNFHFPVRFAVIVKLPHHYNRGTFFNVNELLKLVNCYYLNIGYSGIGHWNIGR
jgi:hypothetical protein